MKKSEGGPWRGFGAGGGEIPLDKGNEKERKDDSRRGGENGLSKSAH